MKRRTVLLSVAMFVLGAAALLGCRQGKQPPLMEPKSDIAVDSAFSQAESSQLGTLEIRANGEDFVRRGLVSKDGWRIKFEHVYVNLSDIKAYQADPPFDPFAGGDIQAVGAVHLNQSLTVDLALGDEEAAPILVGQLAAQPGRYNALTWKMLPADRGPTAGSVLTLVGLAERAERAIRFTIKVNQPYTYACGDFVGDQRKGILKPGGNADLEVTFHFDHLFGNGELPADDPVNTDALGFDPLAVLADDGRLQGDLGMLKEGLSVSHYLLLESALSGLAHVGEGHCKEGEALP
ncbi:MAG: DUF4382 domain-containing protein [Leptolyngbyaceae cyanobacterium MO_188.B28]|nr:DUF4382 domain-containing protein [Leptolyngbyaceae cyanobacterium MO_188.B28]